MSTLNLTEEQAFEVWAGLSDKARISLLRSIEKRKARLKPPEHLPGQRLDFLPEIEEEPEIEIEEPKPLLPHPGRSVPKKPTPQKPLAVKRVAAKRVSPRLGRQVKAGVVQHRAGAETLPTPSITEAQRRELLERPPSPEYEKLAAKELEASERKEAQEEFQKDVRARERVLREQYPEAGGKAPVHYQFGVRRQPWLEPGLAGIDEWTGKPVPKRPEPKPITEYEEAVREGAKQLRHITAERRGQISAAIASSLLVSPAIGPLAAAITTATPISAPLAHVIAAEVVLNPLWTLRSAGTKMYRGVSPKQALKEMPKEAAVNAVIIAAFEVVAHYTMPHLRDIWRKGKFEKVIFTRLKGQGISNRAARTQFRGQYKLFRGTEKSLVKIGVNPVTARDLSLKACQIYGHTAGAQGSKTASDYIWRELWKLSKQGLIRPEDLHLGAALRKDIGSAITAVKRGMARRATAAARGRALVPMREAPIIPAREVFREAGRGLPGAWQSFEATRGGGLPSTPGPPEQVVRDLHPKGDFLPIDDLILEPRFQPRAAEGGFRAEKVKRMVETFDPRLLTPLIVWDSPEGPKLLAGWHRLEALRRLGFKEAGPLTMIKAKNAEDALDIARRSNVADFYTPVEQGKIYQQEIAEHLPVKSIAKRYNQTQKQVKDMLQLNHLSPSMQQAVRDKMLDLPLAVELGRAAHQYNVSGDVQQEIFDKFILKFPMSAPELATALKTLMPEAMKMKQMALGFKIPAGFVGAFRKRMLALRGLEREHRRYAGVIRQVAELKKKGKPVPKELAEAAAYLQKRRAELLAETKALIKSIGLERPPAVKKVLKAKVAKVSAEDLAKMKGWEKENYYGEQLNALVKDPRNITKAEWQQPKLKDIYIEAREFNVWDGAVKVATKLAREEGKIAQAGLIIDKDLLGKPVVREGEPVPREQRPLIPTEPIGLREPGPRVVSDAEQAEFEAMAKLPKEPVVGGPFKAEKKPDILAKVQDLPEQITSREDFTSRFPDKTFNQSELDEIEGLLDRILEARYSKEINRSVAEPTFKTLEDVKKAETAETESLARLAQVIEQAKPKLTGEAKRLTSFIFEGIESPSRAASQATLKQCAEAYRQVAPYEDLIKNRAHRKIIRNALDTKAGIDRLEKIDPKALDLTETEHRMLVDAARLLRGVLDHHQPIFGVDYRTDYISHIKAAEVYRKTMPQPPKEKLPEDIHWFAEFHRILQARPGLADDGFLITKYYLWRGYRKLNWQPITKEVNDAIMKLPEGFRDYWRDFAKRAYSMPERPPWIDPEFGSPEMRFFVSGFDVPGPGTATIPGFYPQVPGLPDAPPPAGAPAETAAPGLPPLYQRIMERLKAEGKPPRLLPAGEAAFATSAQRERIWLLRQFSGLSERAYNEVLKDLAGTTDLRMATRGGAERVLAHLEMYARPSLGAPQFPFDPPPEATAPEAIKYERHFKLGWIWHNPSYIAKGDKRSYAVWRLMYSKHHGVPARVWATNAPLETLKWKMKTPREEKVLRLAIEPGGLDNLKAASAKDLKLSPEAYQRVLRAAQIAHGIIETHTLEHGREFFDIEEILKGEDDPFWAIERFLWRGYASKETARIMPRLNSIIKQMPRGYQNYWRNYINDLDRMPSSSETSMISEGLYKFYEAGPGRAIKERYPQAYQVFSRGLRELAKRQGISFVRLLYSGLLSKAASAGKNLTQNFTTTAPLIGTEWLAVGRALSFKPEYRKLARSHGIIREAGWAAELPMGAQRELGIREIVRKIKNKDPIAVAEILAVDLPPILFRSADPDNRIVAFLSTYKKVQHHVELFERGKIDIKTLKRRLRLDFYRPEVRLHTERLLEHRRGLDKGFGTDKSAQTYLAKETADVTNFIYSRADRAAFIRSSRQLARYVGMFTKWPISDGELLEQAFGASGKVFLGGIKDSLRGKRIGPAARGLWGALRFWLILYGNIFGLSEFSRNVAGVDIERWYIDWWPTPWGKVPLPTAPIRGRLGGPGREMLEGVEDAIDALRSGEGRQLDRALETLKRLGKMPLPASGAVAALQKALEARKTGVLKGRDAQALYELWGKYDWAKILLGFTPVSVAKQRELSKELRQEDYRQTKLRKKHITAICDAITEGQGSAQIVKMTQEAKVNLWWMSDRDLLRAIRAEFRAREVPGWKRRPLPKRLVPKAHEEVEKMTK